MAPEVFNAYVGPGQATHAAAASSNALQQAFTWAAALESLPEVSHLAAILI